MRMVRLLSFFLVIALTGCSHFRKNPDVPRLNADVRMFDSTIHSTILGRDMPIRIMVPASVPAGAHLPVVYLLHGAGATYQAWSNYTDVATLAAHGMVLVMPEAKGGFYINDRRGKHYRFEDYFMQEVIPATHRLVPYAASDRAHTAIVGISRGGYGALVLAFKHPEIFSVVAGLAAAVDLPTRPFIKEEFRESLETLWSVGSAGSPTLRGNDPYSLARTISPQNAPFVLLMCGKDDDLIDSIRELERTLAQSKLPYRFMVVPGNHNWLTWNSELPVVEATLQKQFAQN